MDSVATLVDAARKALEAEIDNATPLVPYIRALAETDDEIPGLYLIYDAEGVLLYIGESIDLRKRLMNHTQSLQGLLGDLVKETDVLGIPPGPARDLALAEAKKGIVFRIRQTFQVRLFPRRNRWLPKKKEGRSRRNQKDARYYEQMLTLFLHPKYGHHYEPVGRTGSKMVPNALLDPKFEDQVEAGSIDS